MNKNEFASKVEYEPLEAPPEQQQQPIIQPQPVYLTGRDYHSHWLCCCGDCDAPGWAACCLVYWFPYIALGWNLKRVSGNSRLGWLAGLVVFIISYYHISENSSYISCRLSFYSTDTNDESYPVRPECGDPVFSYYTVGSILLLMVIGIVSRQYIRKKLRLDSLHYGQVDTFCCDVWSRCFACGLCQETRTLMINRVEDGEWRGPAASQVVYMNVPMDKVQPLQTMV